MTKRSFLGIVKAILVLLLVLLTARIISLQVKIAQQKQVLEGVTAEVAEYTAANEQLKESIQAELTAEEVGEIARTELGYAQPGERIFVDTSSR